ncbi:hypothetical protein [Cytophaga aurantiaca]|uniref:hypothetical protein n=1 Tax=Cytophaga aurantiaca TaxID=29530 RepID=UPI001FE1A206|nr:hypothetical protein [Cytophaga aurantiaca]
MKFYEVMVEVYKTSVQDQLQAGIVKQLLLVQNPLLEINFDLEDCDKILRIKNIEDAVDISSVLKVLNETGIYVEVLTD